MDLIKQPWPWYIAGPLIGLIVPALLLLGNKSFGISSSLKHICAACIPGKVPFFQYDWKKEMWNLFFVGGLLIGGIIATTYLVESYMPIEEQLAHEIHQYGITNQEGLVPTQLFNWQNLLTIKGFIIIIIGGFIVGFGTRYAGGCTSGHAIMGLSNLQLPSLIATCCFMIGGIIVANFILPLILTL